MTKKPKGGRLSVEELVMDGCLLETALPVRAFASLTTPVSQIRSDAIHQWIRGLQAHNRVKIGYIIVYESTLHAHVALMAAASLDCSHARRLWREIAAPGYPDAAKVEPHRDRPCGIGQIYKALGNASGGIEYSDNLIAFAIEETETESMYRSKAAEKRLREQINARLRRSS